MNIMCAPAVLAWAAVAASVAGTGVSAYSSYQSGQSQKKAANYNATVQRQAADDALQRGAIDAAERRQEARKVAAMQETGMAASNLSLSSGSPLDILTETAGMGELDALRTINNAQRQSYGLTAQADIDQYKGKAASRAGKLNAGASLLSGAANTGSFMVTNGSYFGFKN